MRSPIVYQFEKIINHAQLLGLPVGKKSSILREFLQVKILEKIYSHSLSKNLFFVGGTSLCLTRGLDRFSEDLDFDFRDLGLNDIEKIYDYTINLLSRENIDVLIYKNLDKKPIQLEIRFPHILYELGLHNQKDKNLIIKLDFDDYWQGLESEVVGLDKFGVLTKVVTLPLNTILTQKIFALLNRKKILGRDIYDIVWLISHNEMAKIDWSFARKNRLSETLVKDLLVLLEKEKKHFPIFKKEIEPFLFDSISVNKIDFVFDYFVDSKEIFFKDFYVEEMSGLDMWFFTFIFGRNNKEVRFVFRVTETACCSEDFPLPLSKTDDSKIQSVKEKILFFLDKNIFKNYQTKIISTTNLVDIFSFDDILE